MRDSWFDELSERCRRLAVDAAQQCGTARGPGWPCRTGRALRARASLGQQLPSRHCQTYQLLARAAWVEHCWAGILYWLNQIEFYFSILQRKALTPNDFSSLADVEDRLLDFERYYESTATPFDWRFTKDDIDELMKKLTPAANALQPAD